MSWQLFFENPLPWPSEEKGSPLCRLCKSLVWRFSQVREKPSAHDNSKDLEDRTVEDMENFAMRGCHFCHLFIRSLSDEDRKKIKEHIYTRLEIRSYYNRHRQSRQLKKFYVYIYYGRNEYGSSINSITKLFRIEDAAWLEDQPHTFPGLILAYENSNRNDKCFALMRKWTQNCEESHPMCRRDSALPQREDIKHLPGRLLYVGKPRSSRLHLLLGSSLSAGEKYVTLSHRWGTNAPLRLTISSLESFMDEVPLESLPNTFKDAVTITRELGSDYLWIDSLCIIQDSPEDWQCESVKMASIYENAWCNLAATKAMGGEDGCFTTRGPADALPCIWDLNTGDPNRPKDALSLVHPESLWDEGVERFGLFKRGWVVQERLLAPRVLHFSQHQVFWECLTLRACETFPQGIQAPGLLSHEVASPTSFTRQPNLRAFLNHHNPEKHMIWKALVEYYCRCELSFPNKDKLIAISGVARRLGSEENYLAGLWLDNLPHHLMWGPENPNPHPGFVRSKQYRAPSWSWASCDGVIKFDNGDSTMLLVNIIIANITPVVDGDRFGQVIDGRIELEGHLEKVRISSWHFDDAYEIRERGSGRDRWETMYLLVMRPKPRHSSLILELTGNAPGQYVRRGYASHEPRENTHINRPFEGPLEENEYEADLGVQESTGLHLYRITII